MAKRKPPKKFTQGPPGQGQGQGQPFGPGGRGQGQSFGQGGRGQGQPSGLGGRGRGRDPLLDVIRSNTPTFRGPNRGPHTLADEARSTAQKRRGGPYQDAKLRYNPVKFVSAGYMNPSDELKVLQDEDQKTAPAEVPVEVPAEVSAEVPAEIPPMDSNIVDTEVPVDTMAVDVQPDDAAIASPVVAEEPVGVNVEATAGTEEVTIQVSDTVAMDTQPSRAPSPPLFVIDTAGDKSLGQKYTGTPVQTKDESDRDPVHDSDSSEEVILFKGRNQSRNTTAPATRTTNTPKPDSDFMQLNQMNTEIKVVEKTIQASNHQFSSTSAEVDPYRTPEVDVYKTAEVDVYKTAVPETLPIRQKEDDQRFENLLNGTHSDEEAAMIADYIANMEEEDDEDDDELDQHPGLGSHAFHLLRDIGGTDSDGLPEGISDDDSPDESEQPKGGDGPSTSQAEDERLARLLAKQEQMGLGGNDLFLYDGTGSGDDDGEDWTIAPKTTPRRKKKGSSKTAKIIQKKGQYPSASKMAEAFDELDLMDWHRPALHNYNKRTEIPYISDSDLEEAMNATFKKGSP
ncbi:hypothetical protein PG989_014863 [Apiospora arundinis]